MQQCPCSMQDSKMRFLWFLASGIHYLFFLLFSIFLAVTGTTISTNTAVPPVAINGSTSQARSTTLAPANPNSTKSPFSGPTARSVSTTISTAPEPSLSTNTAVPTREDITAVTALATNGSQLSSTSGITAPPMDNTALPEDNLSAPSAGTSTSNTASGTSPQERSLKYWGIILISLVVTAAAVAGFVGCCFYCRVRREFQLCSNQ
ncbi:mucin-5AC-like [Heteronotia binoei]|uniref:mucin-5AC-like n=1 Tax=Heteronotia binoei TaxID=13085 RepID=UPI00292FCCFD|nr:mucin-5AC-like [Heteronotia binoei]